MALTLHFHPLSSFCQKVLVALYENDTAFDTHVVDLLDERARAAFYALSPLGKMPVLRDEAKDRTVAETSVIIEYLATHYPGKTELLPRDPERALAARLGDRFYDFYVMQPMQKIIDDRLRPAEKKDPLGVERAIADLEKAYAIIDRQMEKSTWAAGETFTLADCAAAPALYYAHLVVPIGDRCRHADAYRKRLAERPSFDRAYREAEPYRKLFPG